MTVTDTGELIDEASRVRALRALNLLDTPEEERFDRITRLVQELFEVPMVSITLVDEHRQWRKSYRGEALAQEAPREAAFCDYTVRHNARLVVEDAVADAEWGDNPYVTGDPHLRFYVGEPLAAGTGEAVGTLCILDTTPRHLDEVELRLLRSIADWVQDELERDDDLDRAAAVQRNLLPKGIVRTDAFDVAALCRPARGAGGDFYDWYVDDDDLLFSIADVMGKGVGAALVAATVRAVLRSSLRMTGERPDLAASLNRASALLALDLSETSRFVTVFQARLERPTGIISYVDAGHGLALRVPRTGPIERTLRGGLPLGLDTDPLLEEHSIQLEVGDTFIAFSDGLFDLMGGDEGVFEQLAYLVRRKPSAIDVVQGISNLMALEHPLDDVTAVVIRRNA